MDNAPQNNEIKKSKGSECISYKAPASYFLRTAWSTMYLSLWDRNRSSIIPTVWLINTANFGQLFIWINSHFIPSFQVFHAGFNYICFLCCFCCCFFFFCCCIRCCSIYYYFCFQQYVYLRPNFFFKFWKKFLYKYQKF